MKKVTPDELRLFSITVALPARAERALCGEILNNIEVEEINFNHVIVSISQSDNSDVYL